MSPTAGRERYATPTPRRRRAETGGIDPAHDLRALLRALHQWWSKERYRPERRYMRG